MSADFLAVILGCGAIIGQALNYVLHLRVRAAILESEKWILEKISKDYVRKETCVAEMRWLEAHPHQADVDPDD